MKRRPAPQLVLDNTPRGAGFNGRGFREEQGDPATVGTKTGNAPE
jgi:hypothetical protein